MTSIFRSVRFGASSAHGKANMISFNYFNEAGAITRDAKTGFYNIDFKNLQKAMDSLSELILTLHGNGEYDGVAQLVLDKGVIKQTLKEDLEGLAELGIPVDFIL